LPVFSVAIMRPQKIQPGRVPGFSGVRMVSLS
jgi:hypothetical protein